MDKSLYHFLAQFDPSKQPVIILLLVLYLFKLLNLMHSLMQNGRDTYMAIT